MTPRDPVIGAPKKPRTRGRLLRRGLALAGLAALAARLPATDLAEVRQRGVLRVLAVVVEDEPEFFATDPGSPPGFDHEVVEGFARLHHLRVEVVEVAGWDRLIPDLLADEGDVIAGRFTATESRRKQIAFTVEVFPTRNVVVTRKPHRVVRTLAELRQEKIGVVTGTSMRELLEAAGVPRSAVDDTLPSGSVPAALREGRITCTVDEVAGAVVAQGRDPALQIGMFLGPPASYAFGVRKADRALLAALDEYLENLRRSPTWNRLVVKYFGDAAPEVLGKARERD
jgi:ABC-type amino acid transport substrate-binding protein